MDKRKHVVEKTSLKILKRQMPVTLWVHPEGKVVGSMFLTFPSSDSAGGEQPADVINRAVDFLVFKLEDTDEIRFYNKSSIIRVEYWDGSSEDDSGRPQPCRITMMDGALFEGEISKQQPEEYSRLYDYMNDTRERFLSVRLGDGLGGRALGGRFLGRCVPGGLRNRLRACRSSLGSCHEVSSSRYTVYTVYMVLEFAPHGLCVTRGDFSPGSPWLALRATGP